MRGLDSPVIKSTIREPNMTDITGAHSPPQLPPDVLRRLRWGAAVVWISWCLSIGLILVEHWLWILDPWSLLLLILLIVTFGAVEGSPPNPQ